MIRLMSEHKVAANLLMVIILLSGLMGIMNIKQEVFPEMELDFIVVAVPYSGATPEEIEKSILLPIEDAVGGINGIKKIIWRELANYECQIVGSVADCDDALKDYGITKKQIMLEWSDYFDYCFEMDYF